MGVSLSEPEIEKLKPALMKIQCLNLPDHCLSGKTGFGKGCVEVVGAVVADGKEEEGEEALRIESELGADDGEVEAEGEVDLFCIHVPA